MWQKNILPLYMHWPEANLRHWNCDFSLVTLKMSPCIRIETLASEINGKRRSNPEDLIPEVLLPQSIILNLGKCTKTNKTQLNMEIQVSAVYQLKISSIFNFHNPNFFLKYDLKNQNTNKPIYIYLSLNNSCIILL